MARVLHLFNVLGAPTEATWLELAMRLSALGHEIVIAYETLAGGARLPDLRCVRVPRIAVEPSDDIPAQMTDIATQTTIPGAGEFDLVHGHLGTRILHASTFLAHGTPTILSLYGYDTGRLLRDPCWVRRYRWAAEHGATFVVLCRAMADTLHQHGIPDEAVRVIPLGIDLRKWVYDPQPVPSPPRFVFVGRLVPKKCPDILIDAFRIIADDTAATLDIVGNGPMRAQIEEQISRHGLTGRIHLHDELPRDKVADLLRGAAALVLSSAEAPDGDREGTPIVLMEAQALGTPCITTDHSGNPDVLPPESRSFIVPQRDADALARAMTHMLRLGGDPRRAIQDAGRAWITKHFDLDQTVQRYDALYSECLCRARAAHSPAS